eukprot:Nitzschia sp. Nitz4//scaffold36_size144017//32352//34025//NITZ4_003071-RA/size144017-snap-gene-0.190-mRNA-1//1//CDS//3329549411//7185//frame0
MQVLTLSNDEIAWNMDGSASDRPKVSRSWIQEWETTTGQQRGDCSFVGCNTPAEHGGHVWISTYGGVFIAPICRRCNDFKNQCRQQGSGSRIRGGTLVIPRPYTEDMYLARRRFVSPQDRRQAREPPRRMGEDNGDSEQFQEQQCIGFVKASQLEMIERESIINIIGVVQECSNLQPENKNKTGKKFQKLMVTIVDETGVQVRVLMWDQQAITASQQISYGRVVVFHQCQVSHDGGASLNEPRRFFVNPDVPETQELLDWWIVRGVQGLDMNPIDHERLREDPLEFCPGFVFSPPKSPMYKRRFTTNSRTSVPNPSSSAERSSSSYPRSSSPCNVAETSFNKYGGSPTSGAEKLTPIAKLNRNQSQWTTKARVVSKSNIRTWSTRKGEGVVFSMELSDTDGMNIRAALFNEAAYKFYDMLQVGSVYIFSKGHLKAANARFNTCKSDLEMTLDCNSEIRLCSEKAGGTVPRSLNFLRNWSIGDH